MTGKLRTYQLTDGSIYVSGPLRGFIVDKDGSSNKIIVGFQNILGEEDIDATVTLCGETGYSFFSFGSMELPDEVAQNVYSQDTCSANDDFETSDIGIYSATGSPDETGYGYDEYGNYLLQELSSGYVEGEQVLAVSVSSYSSNAKKCYSGSSFARVYEVSATCKTENSYAAFNRYFQYPGEDNKPNDIGSFVIALIEDLVALWQDLSNTSFWVPLNSALDQLSNTHGSTYDTMNRTQTKCSITSEVSSGDFDDAPWTMALVLEANKVGTYEVTVTTDITYLVMKSSHTIYIDSESASVSLNCYIEH